MNKKKLKEEIIKKSENNTIVVSYQKTLKNLFRICDSMEKNRTKLKKSPSQIEFDVRLKSFMYQSIAPLSEKL